MKSLIKAKSRRWIGESLVAIYLLTTMLWVGASALAQTASWDRLVDDGIKQHDAGRHNDAIKLFQQALKSRPGHILATIWLAQCCSDTCDISQARALFQDVIKRGRSSDAQEQRAVEKAREKLSGLDTAGDRCVEMALKMAASEFFSGRYDACIAFSNDAIELDKYAPKAYYWRAEAQYKLGNTEKACLDWNTCLYQDPNGPNKDHVSKRIAQVCQVTPAEKPIQVSYNCRQVVVPLEPAWRNGWLMVPAVPVLEKMGFMRNSYDPLLQKITFARNEQILEMYTGKNVVVSSTMVGVRNNERIVLREPVIEMNGYLLVPVQLFTQLNERTEWDEKQRILYIGSKYCPVAGTFEGLQGHSLAVKTLEGRLQLLKLAPGVTTTRNYACGIDSPTPVGPAQVVALSSLAVGEEILVSLNEQREVRTIETTVWVEQVEVREVGAGRLTVASFNRKATDVGSAIRIFDVNQREVGLLELRRGQQVALLKRLVSGRPFAISLAPDDLRQARQCAPVKPTPIREPVPEPVPKFTPQPGRTPSPLPVPTATVPPRETGLEYRPWRQLDVRGVWIHSVAIAPDGKSVAAGCQDGSVRLWDVVSGRERVLRGHTGAVYALAFSPADSSVLVSGGNDATVRSWDLDSGQSKILRGILDRDEKVALVSHRYPIHTIAFSQDGRLLVTGSREARDSLTEGDVKLWELPTGRQIQKLTLSSGSFALSLSGDKQRLVVTDGRFPLALWTLQNGLPQAQVGISGNWQKMKAVAISPNGKRIVTGNEDHALRLWDLTGNEGTMRWATTIPQTQHGSDVLSVAFTPDGSRVVSGSADDTIRIWDAATGELRQILEGHSQPVTSVAISRDGALLVSGSRDGTLRLWRPGTR